MHTRINSAFRLYFVLSICFLLVQTICLTTAAASERERLSLDRQWRFHLGDIPFPIVTGHGFSYHNAKAGTASGAASMDYDISSWPTVDLPHDWAIETPIDKKNNLSQGFHARGISWYRREFKLDPSDRGKHLELQFDGIATHCTVWVNGMVAHRNFCGYTGFFIDITPFARYGDDRNAIAIRVDADAQEGWWYEGAGIYRHTWLVKRNATHIATDGVYANPVRVETGKWQLPIEITINSSARSEDKVDVECTLLDSAGKEIAQTTTSATAIPTVSVLAKTSMNIDSPTLWSLESPTLYTLRTRLLQNEKPVDQASTRIGFRTIRFDPTNGFFLNDQHVKLQGTCNHQDHAGVGVAVPDALWDFRIRKLKEMGSNAYRCAHNPPAPEFLDACDRLGMLVMDENRNFNTTDEYIRQLTWLVRRDRNHPSVILWSVFNEEPFQGSELGYEMVRRLVAVVKQLDKTRPVTAAQSGGMMSPSNASLAADVAGFNYNHGQYDRYHALHPDIPITSSEDTSAVITRGEYVTEKKTQFTLDSYDTQHQGWGLTHRTAWKLIDQRPFLAGGFVWTGFDYRGEPQPLEWPATGSSFGCMDQCGFPKSAFYIHQAHWINNRPVLQLIPHWTWPGSEGKPIRVLAISNCDEVEILLNGKSIERKPSHRIDMVEFKIPYQPGKLEAVGFRDGKEFARFAVETTGPATALALEPDRDSLSNDGSDAMPVTIKAIDDAGRVVPDAKPFAKLSLQGDGKILGIGNGDPLCHEPEKSNQRSLFHGLAQVIIQSQRNGSAPLTLTASADGLKSASVTIQSTSVAPIASVDPVAPLILIRQWICSPASNDSPDPLREPDKTDMNTWTAVNPGRPQPLVGGKFALLRSTFTPPASLRATGGTLLFKNFTGQARFYLNGQLALEKKSPSKESINLPFPPSTADLKIAIILIAEEKQPVGLGGAVSVE